MPDFYRNPGGYNPAAQISLIKFFKESPEVFLAEGPSEAFFFEALFRDRGKSPDECAVFCYGGNKNLGVALKSIKDDQLFPDVNVMGIMTDANSNPSGVRVSVIGHCRNIGYIGERTPLRSGVASFQGRKLGIFVTPGRGRRGQIETLIKMEISDEPENPCIEAFSDCLANATGKSLSEKAIAQVFITSRKDSLCGVGRAFDAGILDINNAAYANAVSIFSNL